MSETSDTHSSPVDSAVANSAEATLAALLDRATNAVAAIEQHARTATAESTSATESKAQSIAAAAQAQSRLQEIAEIAGQATAAKTSITDAQSVIATKSTHIEGAQKHADQVRGDLDARLTAAQAQVTEIDGLKARVSAVTDSVEEMKASVTQNKTDTDAALTAARQSLTDAQKAAADAKKLADKADEVDARIRGYEARLLELSQESADQLKIIVGLLPGATSAGLASAFDARRKTFLMPSEKWQNYFVLSVLALVGLAATGLIQLYMGTDPLTYEKLLRVWLARLPVAGALIWLALYASRESALAKRLEEDYGYKSAIAASFQGFQKQMQEVLTTVGTDSPLGRLCYNTLAEIANPPGRIYDKHALTVSPSSEINDLMTALSGALAKATGKGAA